MPTSAAVRTVLALGVSVAAGAGCRSHDSPPAAQTGLEGQPSAQVDARGITESAARGADAGPSPRGDDVSADAAAMRGSVPRGATLSPSTHASTDPAAAPTLAVRWPLDEIDLLRTFGWSIDPVRHVDEHHDDVLLRARDGTFVLAPFSGEVVRVSPAEAVRPGATASSLAPGDSSTVVTLRRDELEVELEGSMTSLVLPGMLVEARAAVAITSGTGPLRLRTLVGGVALDPLQLVGTLESDLPAVLAAAMAARRPASSPAPE